MSLEDEIVKSRKKQTMMQMVAADKLAAKKKILARKARAKLLKEQSRKQDRQIPNRMTKAEREYIKTYGFSPSKIPAKNSSNKSVIKDKVTVTKSNSTNKRLQNSKNEKVKDNFMQQIALKIKKDNENKNIKKAGELENNKQKNDKKKSTSKSKWEQYSSIAAAKKAGSLYYSKGGKRFAAVYAEDLKGVKGSSPSAKLRAYLNDKEKKRK